jgi:hypothetical protein
VRVGVGVDLALNALSKRDSGAEVGEVGVCQHLHKVSAHRCTEVACETQGMVKDLKLAQPPPPPPMTLEGAKTSGVRGVGEVAPR